MSTTTGPLFDRWWRITVGEKTVEALRVEFKVVRTLTEDPNAIEFSIYNLSADSRAKVQSAAEAGRLTATVEAGYQDERRRGILGSGDVATIDHVRRGPDWVTRIRVLDGWRRIITARVSDSLAPGTKIVEALKTAIKPLVQKTGQGAQLGEGNALRMAAAADLPVTEFTQGFVLRGRAYQQAQIILQAAGLEISVQNGVLQVLKPLQTKTETAVLLSPSTGLIDSPETGAPDPKTKRVLTKMRALLNHQIEPGRALKLEGVVRAGEYRVEKVTHTGDSHGQGWYSEIEAIPRRTV